MMKPLARSMLATARTGAGRLAAAMLCLLLGGCNPTWTTKGKPNDSSMPLPPGAKAPERAGANPTAQPQPAKP